MKIYCLSGLGADQRAFEQLQLPDHQLIHLPWLDPTKQESLRDYSSRMLEAIDTSQPFALLGLSFGGLVAQNIATLCAPEYLILISSLQNRQELPTVFRVLGGMGLHRLVPGGWLCKYNFITRYYFGPLSGESKILLRTMLRETDPIFLKWAIGQILKMQPANTIKPFRIHGAKDRIIPIPSGVYCSRVSRGGHLIIIDEAFVISKLINSILGETTDEKH